MTAGTHTPGPLTVVEDWLHGRKIDGPLYDLVAADGQEVVAHLRSKADADLFAVAGEMLEALRLASDEIARLRDAHLPRSDGKVGEPDAEVLMIARAAIAKAGK